VYQLSKMIGTPRYMAPEVALGRNYNETCDIYSLGILLWEFITLKRPYTNQECMEDLKKNVWITNGRQIRPPIPKKLSSNLKELLNRAWDGDLNQRPSAIEFENTLRLESSLVPDNGVDQKDRRSTFVLIPGKGEAINRSSPTVTALSGYGERDSAISRAVGASSDIVFTSTSVRSESNALPPPPPKSVQSDGAILDVLRASRDREFSVSVGSGNAAFPPTPSLLLGESVASIDSLDL